MDTALLEFVSIFISIFHKVTRNMKLRGVQRSPELALKKTDFCALENVIFPALIIAKMIQEFYINIFFARKITLKSSNVKVSPFLVLIESVFYFRSSER